MRISDWSSDVCSSDLGAGRASDRTQGPSMLYHAFDMQKSWLSRASALATAGAQAMQHPSNPLGYFGASPLFASALEVFAHAAAPRGKPAFDLYETVVDGETVRVSEAVAARKPRGQRKHFKHKGTPKGAGAAPKLLIVDRKSTRLNSSH